MSSVRCRLPLLILSALLAMAPGPAAAVGPVDQLARVLRTAKDYKQRLAAAIGLARLGDRQAVPTMIEALKDPQPTVRGTVAGALGKLGDARARPALEALVQRETDAFVLRNAQTALAAILRGGAPAGKPADPDDIQVDGTVGTIDEESAQSGVEARLRQVTTCYMRERASATYLTGRMDLKFRVTTSGKVRWVRLERSDLGSVGAEQCIVRELASASFAAPDGGEAEFKIPLALDPQSVGLASGVPASPQSVPADAKKLLKACKKLLKGPGAPLSAPPGLLVTFYIDPEGAIVSAGVSAPGGQATPELATELVNRIKAFRMPARDDGHVIKVVTPFACSR